MSKSYVVVESSESVRADWSHGKDQMRIEIGEVTLLSLWSDCGAGLVNMLSDALTQAQALMDARED